MNIPSNFTLAEASKYIAIPTELAEKIEEVMYELHQSKVRARERDRELELANEGVYFRDIFIEGVLEEISICKNYEDLVKAIRTRFEESGIEY